MERRSSLRFDMQLPCRLRCNGGPAMMDGLTINLSRSGALILMTNVGTVEFHPRMGDAVKLEVPLPAHERFGPRCLACDAVALRTTEQAGSSIVALRFERMEIQKLKPQTPVVLTTAVM